MAATSKPSEDRRLTRKGVQTRQRIVAEAARLMYELGTIDATLEEIRDAAKVSGSQIYHYFPDKQALLLAVIEHQTQAVLDRQQPHLGRLDSLEGLRRWRDMLVESQRLLQCRGGCPLGTLGSEVAESDPAARLAVASGFQRWEGAIRTGLSAMHGRGELDGDPENLALGLLAALQGGLLLAQLQRSVRPLEVALDTVLDHIRTLVRPVPAPDDPPEAREGRRA